MPIMFILSSILCSYSLIYGIEVNNIDTFRSENMNVTIENHSENSFLVTSVIACKENILKIKASKYCCGALSNNGQRTVIIFEKQNPKELSVGIITRNIQEHNVCIPRSNSFKGAKMVAIHDKEPIIIFADETRVYGYNWHDTSLQFLCRSQCTPIADIGFSTELVNESHIDIINVNYEKKKFEPVHPMTTRPQLKQ